MEQSVSDYLVIEAQGGNVRAFELLYKHYNRLLQRFAFRLSGDEQLAHDAVQEAWLTIAKSLGKLKDPRGFRVWVYKTVRWRVTDQFRRKGDFAEALEDSHMSIDYDADKITVTPDQLENHINRLSPDDHHTFTLFYLNELSLLEIAEVLDIPAGTVKSRLNRARKTLRKQISGDDNE